MTAAELLRQEASAARAEADRVCEAGGARADRFREYLQRYPDQQAIVAWTRRRKAQHLDEAAAKCERAAAAEDVTVSERGPRRG